MRFNVKYIVTLESRLIVFVRDSQQATQAKENSIVLHLTFLWLAFILSHPFFYNHFWILNVDFFFHFLKCRHFHINYGYMCQIMNVNDCERIFSICLIKDSIVVQTNQKLQKVDRANFETWLHLEEFLMHKQLSKKFDPLT